jgi:deoxyribose-phosphate aldolase
MHNSKFPLSEEEINADLARILSSLSNMKDDKLKLKTIFSCIDNTTLEGSDNENKIKDFCSTSVAYIHGNTSLASICVYPIFVGLVKDCLQGTGIKTASVAGGFPSAQMPFDLRMKEIEYSVKQGADEIDAVISRGLLLARDYDRVYKELLAIRDICKDVKLKVILETGELQTIDNIYIASNIAIESGADFIKTSTGKISVGATEQAAYVMLTSIIEHFKSTGKLVGFKASGGISSVEQAIKYLMIAENFYGSNNVDNKCFRIGASRLTKLVHEQMIG